MATVQLWVNSADASGSWTNTGSSPYLDAQDQPTNYSYSTGRNSNSDVFGFDTSSDLGTINSVYLYIYAYGVSGSNFTTYLNTTIDTGLGPPTSWGWVSVDVSSYLTTWAAINAATIFFDRPNTTNNAGVDAAYLLVDYTAAAGETLEINTADTPSVDESLSHEFLSFINKNDTVSVQEDITVETILAPFEVNVNDTCTASDIGAGTDLQQFGSTDGWNFSILPDGSQLIIGDLTSGDIVEFGVDIITGGTASVTVEVEEASADINISTYDETTVEEAVTLLFENWVLSVYDEIIIEESATTVLELKFVSVYDEAIVEENAVAALGTLEDFTIDVYSEAIIEEAVIFETDSFIGVSDESTVEDNVEATLELKFISVYDEVTIEESVSTALEFRFVNVYDEVAVEEDITTTIGATEPFSIDVYSESTVEESVTLEQTSFIDTYDETTLEENVSTSGIEYVSKSDTISVEDAVTVVREEAVGLIVSVYDEVTLDESVSAYFDFRFISVYDTANTEDNVIAFVGTTAPYYIDVNEVVSTDENVGIEFTERFISVYDEVTLEESVEFTWENFVRVYDEVSIDESISIRFTERFVSVSDVVTVDEYKNVDAGEVADLDVVVFDSVTVEEGITANVSTVADLSIEVNDVVSLDEYIERLLVCSISSYDELVVSESTSFLFTELFADTYDQVSISDLTDLEVQIFIASQDVITITDVPVVYAYIPPVEINVYSSVGISELVSGITSACILSTYDRISVVDYPIVWVQASIVAKGTVTVSVESILDLNIDAITDSLGISCEEDVIRIEAVA